MSALRVAQPAPTSSDGELVAAVRHGDDRAFEELYSRFGSRIRSYIFGMVGDHGRAEDITQEVFISALRRLRKTDGLIAFKPWIYEIARNACIDEFRRTRRAQEVSLDADEEGGGYASLLSSAPTPDVAVESKQRLDDLRGAFRGLSDSHHQIIVLREFEGLSYSEIAKRMGMTRPIVESTLFRARRRLGEEYEELVSGRRCEHVQAVVEDCDSRAVRALGIRERRQIARHLAHCQPCRRHAHMAGFDDSALKPRSVVGKVAALLPLPWLRWRRGNGHAETTTSSISHQLGALQSLPTLMRITDPSGPSAALGRAATAAVAAIALAGVSGGLVAGISSQGGGSPRPRALSPAGAGGTEPSIDRAVRPAAVRSVAPAGAAPNTPRSTSHGTTAGGTASRGSTQSTTGTHHVVSTGDKGGGLAVSSPASGNGSRTSPAPPKLSPPTIKAPTAPSQGPKTHATVPTGSISTLLPSATQLLHH